MTTQAAYLNPLFERDFPDPFILKHRGEYWAYCTGFWDDGRCFGILHSRDLVEWKPVAGAMAPLPEGHTCYWAPEVTYDNGRFYLYYSAGNEEQMQIRVALADDPAGPFVDSGRRLTGEPFAIDPHVFVDKSGSWFLFYATDFLEHERIGTGTVRDRMLDPLTLLGLPDPVTRPAFDWQIYDPERAEKGGVCWHTVEGPFVLEHRGRYYQMFSGGNWRDSGYGVSYATSDSLTKAEEWEQQCDGVNRLPILRTVPGQVIGPGHNSVVRGPDNRQLYCVYHRWEGTKSGRLLAIDPLEWAGERLLVLGPSQTPQPAPIRPTFAEFFDTGAVEGLGPAWACAGGHWRAGGGEALQLMATEKAEAICQVAAAAFLAEVSVRLLAYAAVAPPAAAAYGATIYGEAGPLLDFQLLPEQRLAAITWQGDAGWCCETFPLPTGFDAQAYHLLRLEVDGQRVQLSVDEKSVQWQGRLGLSASYRVGLCTQGAAAAFSGFALTAGWEEWFPADGSPAALGWAAGQAPENWQVENGRLQHLQQEGEGRLQKGPLLAAYELVVNASLERATAGAVYGFLPAVDENGRGPLLTVEREGDGWAVFWQEQEVVARFLLPPEFEAGIVQQFRFRREEGLLTVYWQERRLGEGRVAAGPARVGLYARGPAAFELVRVTAIGD